MVKIQGPNGRTVFINENLVSAVWIEHDHSVGVRADGEDYYFGKNEGYDPLAIIEVFAMAMSYGKNVYKVSFKGKEKGGGE